MHLESHSFEISGVPCTTYTLAAPSGMQVRIFSYGASITQILVPDRHGRLENIVLAFQHPEEYCSNPLYAGAILAPCAGRISKGHFTLGDQDYHLSKNDGSHHIHGGSSCASFQNWEYHASHEAEHQVSISLSLLLPDGLDGYPGNRRLNAEYTLDDSGSLLVRYTCTTDAETYLNLSNHSYFNLSGDFSRDCYGHTLQISSDFYIANNKEHLPTGLLPVKDTPFDFRAPVSLLTQMRRYPDHMQLQNAQGYNNGFVLSGCSAAGSYADGNAIARSDSPALILSEKKSGRRLSLYTNAPCIVLYSGGYITSQNELAGNISPCQGCALALEPQEFPDAPNHPGFSVTATKASDCYVREIRYCFEVE